ncbi:hypothetical protein BU17DRAFT_53132 [Hysterangium stoloniferum]|nr:hypothetical protein BU17DRAFT_53132 [Hysterangium stoloniferum]
MSQSAQSDPRDASLEAPLTLPKSWKKDVEGLSAISMFVSGAVMVSRNRYLAWPALIVAIAGYVTSRPMRQKDGGQGFSGIVFALAAMFTAYLPMFILPPIEHTGNQVPLPA